MIGETTMDATGTTAERSGAGTPPRDRPGPLRTWWVAIRPFALPASTMPVVFGTVLAVTVGAAPFAPALFLAAFAGMALLHCGANLLNDVVDFRRGLDRRVHPGSGAVVRGWITPRRGLLAAALFLALGSALGLWVVSIAGLPVLWIGLAGVAIGILYSAGPFSLKDHAMGDLAVFGTFGVLGALGAWTAQTGSVSWVPALWSVPIALLVSGILHSNNWRDIRSDTDGGVRTVASLLGDRASVAWYAVLLFVPYVLVAGFVGLSALDAMHPAMPPAALAACLSLPLAVRLFRRGLRRHAPDATLDFVALDAATGQLNLVFGLLYTAGFGLAALIGG